MVQPYVEISLTPTVTGSDLRLAVQLRGMVPEPYDDASGQPLANNGQAVLKTRLNFGDGSPPTGSDGGAVHCLEGAALAPVDMTWSYEGAFAHTYAAPGTYTATFTVSVCGLGDVSRAAEVTAH